MARCLCTRRRSRPQLGFRHEAAPQRLIVNRWAAAPCPRESWSVSALPSLLSRPRSSRLQGAQLSTLLGGLRWQATCGNAGPHGGDGEIHGKDVVTFSQERPSGSRGATAPGPTVTVSKGRAHLPRSARFPHGSSKGESLSQAWERLRRAWPTRATPALPAGLPGAWRAARQRRAGRAPLPSRALASDGQVRVVPAGEDRLARRRNGPQPTDVDAEAVRRAPGGQPVRAGQQRLPATVALRRRL